MATDADVLRSLACRWRGPASPVTRLGLETTFALAMGGGASDAEMRLVGRISTLAGELSELLAARAARLSPAPATTNEEVMPTATRPQLTRGAEPGANPQVVA